MTMMLGPSKAVLAGTLDENAKDDPEAAADAAALAEREAGAPTAAAEAAEPEAAEPEAEAPEAQPDPEPEAAEAAAPEQEKAPS